MVSYTFVGDFETTVYEGQEKTEVWASAIVPLYSEDVEIMGSLEATLNYLKQYRGVVTVYYHNLKFDGSFWLSYLLNEGGYSQAYDIITEDPLNVCWHKTWHMPDKSVKYLISDMGAWYTITIRTEKNTIILKDSLKLLPFSVEAIGKAFQTKHRKLSMEYEGRRYANCYISPHERQYIANDVLVVKEALESIFEHGDTKLTIGSCCMEEFKSEWNGSVTSEKLAWQERAGVVGAEFRSIFPNIKENAIDKTVFGAENADEFVRKAYRGGWCYVKKGKEGIIFRDGCTADVNSLYPSVMHSASGNRYPIGRPHFWVGDYIPDIALQDDKYYYIQVKTSFMLKPDMLPTIQVKEGGLYKKNLYLTTSDLWYEPHKRYYHYYKDDVTGEEVEVRPTLTLTMTDWELLKEHYYLSGTEIIGGCWFDSAIGLFDMYIDKYKHEKMTTKGARRTRAKLYLNNLYGKLATSEVSNFKVVNLNEEGVIKYKTVKSNEKEVIYIPAGAAVTAYARKFTIDAAQANYKHFLYADTDSIHCDCSPCELKGINIDSSEFLCWKIESEWDIAKYLRQKTYIEHVIKSDGEEVKPFYELKCAGMTARCKELFNLSIEGCDINAVDENGKPLYSAREKEFLSKRRTIDDFELGLVIPSKLYSKQIRGGTLLFKDDMTIQGI